LSPDGSRVAYAVSWVDADRDEQYSDIHVIDLSTGESRQFTQGRFSNSAPTWSHDGRQIAFLSTRGGPAQIYVMGTDGGEARALTRMERGVSGVPLWSPDGQYIAFTSGPENEARDPSKPYRVTRALYRLDGMDRVEDGNQAIYIVPAAGGDPRRLLKTDYSQRPIAWSPDSSEILFSASLFPDLPEPSPRLRVLSLDGRVRDVLEGWGYVPFASWAPDGKGIVFQGRVKGASGSNHDLWVSSPLGSPPQCRTTGLSVGVGGGVQTDMPVAALATQVYVARDGSAAIVGYHEGGRVGILRVALSGSPSWQPVVSGDRVCLLCDATDKHLLYSVSELNNPSELYICDLDGSNERRLTHINDEALAEFELPTTERILFDSGDGVRLEGWITKPTVGTAPYPTVLYTHGGPTSAFGYMFQFDFQMLAAAGYAVLGVNFRGSTGYGDEFSDALDAGYGEPALKDSIAGLDYAISKGLSDPQRLGCCGSSYGGYLSCWMVGVSHRFKAAVAESPLTNMVSLYGIKEVSFGFAQGMGGRPWEIPDAYARLSPLTNAHKCTTPTLLIHCEKDRVCPIEQSEEFYATLKSVGCTVEMLRLPNCGHSGLISGPISHRRATKEALLDWMNQYVLGKS
jgi:dipeptidyl aminopeptidase/acylaminoacyl peptidase